MPRKPTKHLTKRQTEVLHMIRDWIETQGFPPTRRDIARYFEFKSPNASEEHLKSLERKGAIIVKRHASRGIFLTPKYQRKSADSIPVVGRVAAGSPVLAEEHVEKHVDVSSLNFKPRPDYFLKVQGTSMINLGILEDDLIAVHKTTDVKNGQVVVARIDNDVTVKVFERLPDGGIALVPANPEFQTIFVDPSTEGFAIEGLSVGLVREL